MTQKYRLVPLEPLKPTLEVQGEGVTWPVTEVEPGPNKRYLVSLDIGSYDPIRTPEILEMAHQQLSRLFAPGTFVVCATSQEHPTVGLYELQLVDPEG